MDHAQCPRMLVFRCNHHDLPFMKPFCSSLFIAISSALAFSAYASGNPREVAPEGLPSHLPPFVRGVAPEGPGGVLRAAPAARVVMIGVDGLGARWIPWNEMPNLSRLRDEGVFAVARCHRPTASAINWKSVFSGLPPELHGYNLWNSKEPGIEPPACVFGPDGAMPDLFSEIRRQKPDARTVSLYAWGGLGFCHATNAASVARHFGEGSSEITIDGALAVRSLSGRTLCVFRPAAQGALTYNGLTSLRIEEVCTAVHEESLHLLPGDILCDENYEVEVLPVDGGWLAR